MRRSDKAAIDTDRHGAVRRGLLLPIFFAALEEDRLFFTQLSFHPRRRFQQMIADRHGVESVPRGEHLRQQPGYTAIGYQGSPLVLQVEQFRAGLSP